MLVLSVASWVIISKFVDYNSDTLVYIIYSLNVLKSFPHLSK